ncbi:tetratricopeptide repeat protein [Helicobacter muridarum]|uniref:Tetratricopeptide repeat protein n=1 Tax=Helicobacter muridarum TaxID=216 RepID=A0A099TZJ6_9HELI|nr:tetratricopeptide repeat protein [Helicobacter muridarum]TLD99030.1 tetratricopeptide repeat protein [Helicobacter muridarum]STQ85402.1 Uncharacterised protein [Helicobacter muridarum]
MSRKLLSLAYIYEMNGRYKEAISFFEQVLEKDSKNPDASIIKEARIGLKANQLAIKYKTNPQMITRNMNLALLEKKIDIFKEDPHNLIGWFSQWN